MEQPLRFVAQGEYEKVCTFKTVVYHLSSLRMWFGKFNEAVLEFGMSRCLPYSLQCWICLVGGIC
jgi:hypothetical protein